MRREKRRRGRSILVVLIIALLCVSASFADMVEIKEVQFSFIGLPYYSSQTLGFSQAPSLVGDAAIATGPGTVDYAYSIKDAVVTLSDMALVSGYGTSAGSFGGPATLTVTGKLIKNATSADLTGNVTLLVATMSSPSLDVCEVFSQFASGAALFSTTGGELFGGVADGANTLFVGDFGMGLWGSGVDVLFADNSMAPYNAGVQITTPEPATIGLFSMGMLILLRKRKST